MKREIVYTPSKKGENIDRIRRYALHSFRLFSAEKRVLPYFIVIGAMKAGTTFLSSLMLQHPLIKPSLRTGKEENFFDIHYSKGIKWYKACFPRSDDLANKEIVGDFSPGYLFHPFSAHRISNILPKIRLIVLLRNPVDRAFSNYFHQVRHGNENLSIREAFEAEDKRTTQEMNLVLKKHLYFSSDLYRFSYKRRGIYVEQLIRYFKYFSRNQILIIKSDDLFKSPEKIMHEVYSFLDIDNISSTEHNHVAKNILKDKPKIPESLRKDLSNYFYPYNQRLYKLINRDMGWE